MYHKPIGELGHITTQKKDPRWIAGAAPVVSWSPKTNRNGSTPWGMWPNPKPKPLPWRWEKVEFPVDFPKSILLWNTTVSWWFFLIDCWWSPHLLDRQQICFIIKPTQSSIVYWLHLPLDASYLTFLANNPQFSSRDHWSTWTTTGPLGRGCVFQTLLHPRCPRQGRSLKHLTLFYGAEDGGWTP